MKPSHLLDQAEKLRRELSDRASARFADAIVQLQRARHEADYNPVFRISKADAIGKVQTARDAIAAFELATVDEQVGYLTRVLYKERRA